jgi:di/tricarboxylate transporter
MSLGDVLLVQGSRATVEVMEEEGVFTILDDSFADSFPATHRAPRAVLIFVGAIVLAALEVVPLAVATIGGAVVAFVTRCITPEEAYRQLEWKVLILIGSMLALGVAMEKSGTALFLAQQIINVFGNMPPLIILSAFFFLTVILTQPLSNQAAAVVVLPVAIQTALQLNLDPRTFAIMIAVAASSGFLTPLEPACVMIYGPGRYKFMDFVKVGALLTLLIYVIAIVLVPLLWNPVL